VILSFHNTVNPVSLKNRGIYTNVGSFFCSDILLFASVILTLPYYSTGNIVWRFVSVNFLFDHYICTVIMALPWFSVLISICHCCLVYWRLLAVW